MNKKKAKIKLNVAVYAILLLLTIVLLFASHYASADGTWSQLLNGLSVELLGAVVLFLVAQYFFIWNEDVEKRNDRLDQFLIRSFMTISMNGLVKHGMIFISLVRDSKARTVRNSRLIFSRQLKQLFRMG